MSSFTTSYAADDIMMVKEGKMSAQGFIASEETRYFFYHFLFCLTYLNFTS